MINHFKHKVVRTARQTALFLAAGISAAIGVGFLTTTAWIYLENRYDSLVAALVVGLAYVTMSTILLMIGRSMSDPRDFRDIAEENASSTRELADMPPLASAFIFGLNAGLKVDERRSA